MENKEGVKENVKVLICTEAKPFESKLNEHIKDGWLPKWETFIITGLSENDGLAFSIILTK